MKQNEGKSNKSKRHHEGAASSANSAMQIKASTRERPLKNQNEGNEDSSHELKLRMSELPKEWIVPSSACSG